MRRLALWTALVLAAGPVQAAPIRGNTAGTGVYRGWGLLTGMAVDWKSEEMRTLTAFTELRYTPSTHWVLSLQVPYVEGRLANESTSGIGDVVIAARHRFYRAVGPWQDRHAAAEVGVKLPTGATGERLDLRRIQPGTGSTDVFVDLVYQQARKRWGQAADLRYQHNTEGDGELRFGDEARLNAGAQYVLLPRVYTVPGRELFVLLEVTALRREKDRFRGAAVPGTGRSELLLAPGLQIVATERAFLDLSVQLPIWDDLGREEPRSRWNGLVQLRVLF
ncbi:MAG TPA: hypothetical protein VN493_19010 [Thermoanaerobaculia bacterium]|nr:hypothetical protein [Thermoanaerobaculia bacterium]